MENKGVLEPRGEGGEGRGGMERVFILPTGLPLVTRKNKLLETRGKSKTK